MARQVFDLVGEVTIEVPCDIDSTLPNDRGMRREPLSLRCDWLDRYHVDTQILGTTDQSGAVSRLFDDCCVTPEFLGHRTELCLKYLIAAALAKLLPQQMVGTIKGPGLDDIVAVVGTTPQRRVYA